MDQNFNQNKKINNSNGLATAGLIVSMVSIFIPLMGMMGGIGLVLSIIGLAQEKNKKSIGKLYSILGIIISIVGIVYGVYYFIESVTQLKESLNEVKSIIKIII